MLIRRCCFVLASEADQIKDILLHLKESAGGPQTVGYGVLHVQK